MKKKNVTKLTLMLATAVVSATLGGILVGYNQTAADTATSAAATKTLDSVFEKSGATLAPQTLTIGGAETKVAAYELSNGNSVKLKRNLALKWYTGKDTVQYATVKFSFKDTNFQKIALSMDTVSAWATAEDKTTNTIEFVKGTDGKVTVYVNPVWDKNGALTNAAKAQVLTNPTGELTLQLQATDLDGEFKAAITEAGATANFDALDSFTNIGANYAKYVSKNDYPLTFTATMPDDVTDAKTVVCIHEINGQKFTGVSDDNRVADTAAPVLVVNENFDGLVIGSKFTLNENDDDYKVIDVLQDSNITKKVKCYQYNPATTIEAGKETDAYFDLTTSTVFYETAYQKDGGWTTVYTVTGGEEYVSIYFELSDDTFNQTEGDNQKATYFLSWFADESKATVDAAATLEGSTTGAPAGGDWILLNQKKSAPYYKLTDAGFDVAKSEFQAALEKQAADKYAGSNEELQIPSVKWLIDDNNGYRAMKFTISYYSATSTEGTPSTLSSLSFNNLEIPVATEGLYKFKIFATDTAGNAMTHELDGETVEITSSNIWDMDDIPVFTFEITDKGLKVDEPTASKLKETQVLDKTYTLSSSDMKVVGATNLKKTYRLYKVNDTKYDKLSSVLTKISYEDLASTVDFAAVTDKNYHDAYLTAYVKLVAEQLGMDATTENLNDLKVCFVAVSEQGDTINDSTGEFEKFEWNATSASFKTAEEGEYLIFADFWEGERPEYRATAYKLIVVESKGYQIAGEDNWFEDNIVSVILFAVAGVMLVLIIILLMVKPTDETLEDVEAKAEQKAAKAKKSKKENTDNE